MLHSKQIKQDWIVFLILLFVGCIVCIVKVPFITFAFTTLLFLAILRRAKYSFFSIFAFIMLFSYMQVLIYKETGITSGMLIRVGRSIPFYFDEMSVMFVSFFLSELYFVWFTKIIEKEMCLYRIGHELSAHSAYFLMAIAVLLVILLFPSMPTFKMDIAIRRTQGISGIYGFMLLSLCLAALTIDTSYKHKPLVLGYIFIVFWVFGHAERIEALGFLVYYFIKILNRYSIHDKKNITAGIKKIAIFAIAGGIGMIGTWIGLTRLSNNQVTLLDILNKLMIQGTCSDVLYVLDCAIDMWKHNNLLHGYTYLDYILQLIPMATQKYQVGYVIHDYYFTIGGAFFFTEPMMNFGMVGTLISNIEFFAVMRLLLDRTSKLKTFVWIPIVIEIFRTTWYGRSGWILSSFVEMPLLYLGVRYVLERLRLRPFRSSKPQSMRKSIIQEAQK